MVEESVKPVVVMSEVEGEPLANTGGVVSPAARVERETVRTVVRLPAASSATTNTSYEVPAARLPTLVVAAVLAVELTKLPERVTAVPDEFCPFFTCVDVGAVAPDDCTT